VLLLQIELEIQHWTYLPQEVLHRFLCNISCHIDLSFCVRGILSDVIFENCQRDDVVRLEHRLAFSVHALKSARDEGGPVPANLAQTARYALMFLVLQL
jgi:hypothetical protein